MKGSRLTRWFFPSLLAILAIFAFITPVFAMTPPDSLSVNAVYAYENYELTGDQLYIIDFNIDYGTIPPSKADVNYVIRLMDGATELAWTAPFPYNDNGYGHGIAALYFSPSDAPTWNGNYTVILEGNPMVDWGGLFPYTSLSTFTWESNPLSQTQSLVATKILAMAQELETDWSVDMIETTSTASYLTSNGEAYFINVIPGFTETGAGAFYGNVYQPHYPDITRNDTYANNLEGMSKGTILDIGTPVGNLLGVSRGVATTLVIYGLGIGGLIVFCIRINSYKPLMFLFGIVVVIGWAFGVPLSITVYAGLFAAFLILFEILYKPTPS
jgi:hypothetical protein